MSKPSNRFNFFLPFEINKAKSEGEGKIWINGVCSSKVEDVDEETLDPVGFDFQPLLKSGFFNYNHQGNKTSKAIVGEPTFAEVRNDGNDFYVEGFLYGDSEEAQNIVKLDNTLKNNGSSRKLGFSIEGQATERDPLNPKKINKARITGIAITASPKNPNTLLSIMKGEYAEPFVDIDDELEEVSKSEEIDIEKSLDLDSLVSEYMNWTSAKAHDEYYGKEGNVREFLENNHEDNMDVLHDLMSSINKAMTAAAGEGVTQVESVDGGQKILNELLKEKKILKKSEVYSAILSKYPTANTDQVSKIFKLIEKINNDIMKSEDNVEILEDAITKSFEAIDSNIEKASKADNLDVDKDGDDEDVEEKVNAASDDGDDEKAIDKDDDVKKSESVEEVESKEEDKVEKSMDGDVKKEDAVGGCVDNMEAEVAHSGEHDLELDFFKAMAESRIAKGMTQEEAVADLHKKGLSLEVAQGVVASVISEAQNSGEQGDHDTGTKQEVPSIESGESLSVHEGIKKSEENELEKSESNEDMDKLEKSITESFNNINEKFSTIEKSFADQLTAITSQVSEFVDIHKSVVSEKEALDQEVTSLKEEKEKLEKSLADISNRLENIEQTPNPRKSIVKSVERFDVTSTNQQSGTVYSLSTPSGKKEVLSLLDAQFDNLRANGRQDANLEKSIMNIELGFYSQEDLKYLNNRFANNNITITA